MSRIAGAVATAVCWSQIAIHCFLMTLVGVPAAWLTVPWLDRDRMFPSRTAVFFLGWLTFRVVPFLRVRVEGRENLPPRGPCLLVSNHRSLMDTPALLALGRPVKWVTHRRFHRVPLVGWFLGACGDVAVEPGEPFGNGAAALAIRAWLDRGRTVALYPEGTRSATRAVGRFRPGVFRLAREAGVPVVPVAVTGTEQVLPARRLRSAIGEFRPVTVRVRALPALDARAFPSGDAVAEAARSAIVAALAEMEGTG